MVILYWWYNKLLVISILRRVIKSLSDACLDIIDYFAEFRIRHNPRHENQKANMLAQQASRTSVGVIFIFKNI
jgi:hypothetical protein